MQPARGSFQGFAVLVGLCVVPTLRANLIQSPVHSHLPSPVVTWRDGHDPIPPHEHQHRTDHDPRRGVTNHGGAGVYVANKVWVDRTLVALGGAHALPTEFAHGHQDETARFLVREAVAGPGITAREAADWNSFVPSLIEQAFNAWMAVGNSTGPRNWPGTDNDEAAPPPNGVPWHSSVNWESVVAHGHELEVIYGGAGTGNLGLTRTTPGHSTQATLHFNSAESWFYGINMDPTVSPNSYDFYTTALHEIGHVLGFGHFGTRAAGYVMAGEGQTTRATAVSGILHTIDPDAIHGLRDLYAIAEMDHPEDVPEPNTSMLMLTGGLGLFFLHALYGRLNRGKLRHPAPKAGAGS